MERTLQMATVSFLPKLFRWVFAVLEGVAALCATGIFLLILINPHLPPGAHLGPVDTDFMGQPGSVVLRSAHGGSDLFASVFRGTITLFVANAGGLIELIKHFGLPLILAHAIFFTALFELLRRLFRNVGRGNSFTTDTVRLVQAVGLLLIVFSFLSALGESLFTHVVFSYFVTHATITVSGSPIHLPATGEMRGHAITIFSPMFLYGLLVLALSEVFRQGLALKNENELTI